jgi:hypothetical protein
MAVLFSAVSMQFLIRELSLRADLATSWMDVGQQLILVHQRVESRVVQLLHSAVLVSKLHDNLCFGRKPLSAKTVKMS